MLSFGVLLSLSQRACCGQETTSAARLFELDGWPVAMARLSFTTAHPEWPAQMILGFGAFGSGTDNGDRVAFGLAMRPEGVMVVDATDELWPGSEVLGAKLTREEALGHEHIGAVFGLVDELYLHDELLLGHFASVGHASDSHS